MFFKQPKSVSSNPPVIVLTYDSLGRREHCSNVVWNDSRYMGIPTTDCFSYQINNSQQYAMSEYYCFLYPGAKEMLRWLLDVQGQLPALQILFYGAGSDDSNQAFVSGLLQCAYPDQPERVRNFVLSDNRIFSDGSLTIRNLKHIDHVTSSKNSILVEGDDLEAVSSSSRLRTLFHSHTMFTPKEINLKYVAHVASIGNVFITTGILNHIFESGIDDNFSLPESLGMVIDKVFAREISSEYLYHAGFSILQQYNSNLQSHLIHDNTMDFIEEKMNQMKF